MCEQETECRTGPIFCQDQAGSILLPQKKRNKEAMWWCWWGWCVMPPLAVVLVVRPLTLPKCQRYAQKCTKHSTSRGGGVGRLRWAKEWGQPIPKLQQKCTTAVAAAAADNDEAKRRLRLQHYVYAVVHRWKKDSGRKGKTSKPRSGHGS